MSTVNLGKKGKGQRMKMLGLGGAETNREKRKTIKKFSEKS